MEGPLPVTDDENEYIIEIKNRKSKLPKFILTPKMTERKIANSFMKHPAASFGPPSVVTDSGFWFTSQINVVFCKDLTFKTVPTTEHHVQANENVEYPSVTMISTVRDSVTECQKR